MQLFTYSIKFKAMRTETISSREMVRLYHPFHKFDFKILRSFCISQYFLITKFTVYGFF